MSWWGRRREKCAETHKTAPTWGIWTHNGTDSRLTAPRGTVLWVCAMPTGRVGCAHDTEAQAKWHGKDVWWPAVIDEDEATTLGESA